MPLTGGEPERSDRSSARRRRPAVVPGRSQDRIPVPGLRGRARHRGRREAREGDRGESGQGGRDRGPRLSLLGSLADGRDSPPLFVIDLETRKDRGPDPRSRSAASTRTIRPTSTGSRRTAARSPSPPAGRSRRTIRSSGASSRCRFPRGSARAHGRVRPLTGGYPADAANPVYSPDGRWIVFGMQREYDFYADRVRLVAYDRCRGTHTVLTEGVAALGRLVGLRRRRTHPRHQRGRRRAHRDLHARSRRRARADGEGQTAGVPARRFLQRAPPRGRAGSS